MTEVERMLDQYDRIIDGEAWHGDPVWKILDGITPDQAATRACPNAHTIWELVSHMTFWETVVYRRLNGLPVTLQEEFNFPAMPEPTIDNWNSTLTEFRRSNADFRGAVLQLDPSRLDLLTPGSNKSAYVEAHGVIQHHLYHAGQIAILRRILERK